jgi:hypothetical protein
MQFQKLYESVMINESSLSRLLTHNNDHDCGVISASRKESVGKDNSERRKSLKRDILSHDYDVTDVMGKYEETVNDKKIVVSEDSMFVVDNGDVGELEETLKELGEKYDQESVLILPRGSMTKNAKSYLVGTSKRPGVFPEYGEKLEFSSAKLGKVGEFGATHVNKKPFYMS